MSAAYAELAVATGYSFLRGASHADELVLTAKALGLAGIGVADRNSVAGVVRAHVAARDQGFRLIVGARLVFRDGTPDILAYPRDRAAWARLTRLLAQGKLRAPKGECHLDLADLDRWQEGLNLILCPPALPDEGVTAAVLRRFRGRIRLGAAMLYQGDDHRRLARLRALAQAARVPLLATNDVLYHSPARRPLADVMTCIREHVTLEAAGLRLAANAERHLKPPAEMARLFAQAPEAVAETLAFLDDCRFSLDQLSYDYPDEIVAGYSDPQSALAALAERGIAWRYPGGMPDRTRRTLDKELALIGRLSYAPYFLTVHDIVRFARGQGILCQGRGSAANSLVCYLLGITEVNPEEVDLLFERFVSAERQEPPDIDVDFEHERREEVIQYIYRRYGRDRAALAATVISYRGRSAMREVGKVFGLSGDIAGRLSGMLWGWSRKGIADDEARRAGLDPGDRRLGLALDLARELTGFPRHLSQHVGGFVITRGRLDELVPIENAAMADRFVVEWDKDDLDALRILKIDVLALGMLTCIRKALGLMRDRYGLSGHMGDIPRNEAAVYDMLCTADSVGLFQVESRAQMTMLPRLKPRNYYDLVIEVAIVRPGPIQGNMVHPYLKRRNGEEVVEYPGPKDGDPRELERVLKKTCGVPLFQEQAMQIAMVAAEFSGDEADRLRRAMATFRRTGTIHLYQDRFVGRMIERGYPEDFAKGCFEQIKGFGDYGFPESHAASFALLVYVSAWIKCRYPDVFAAAILNSQPMGFYAPAQLVRDAAEHGVEIRPVDINASVWDNGLEPGGQGRLHPRFAAMAGAIRASHALRLGFRQIDGFKEEDARRIEAGRGAGFDSIRDLWLRTGLPVAALERLALADGFRSLGLDRRDALWAVKGLRRAGDKDDLPLFRTAADPGTVEPDAALTPLTPGQQVIEDYHRLHLSLKGHPVGFLRDRLRAAGAVRNIDLASLKSGRRLTVSGLVLVRQRPGTASGVIFMTLEDETGIANIVVWPKIYEQFRPIVLGARLVTVTGRLQAAENVIHVIAATIDDRTPWLAEIARGDRRSPATALPKGRNFH
ncbi:error-prone DNA polymerase [Zavarzinia compransoris]|uniref:Error-prone DNA polymerase n=1 Tax=Zavarzinia compransoris TaxID=1264899 RepID=A0A317EB67_9PROT|nr:error-prone DNA polymerase [Zavarzinia compransoris]PWR23802.1 error-prone DNA polymerase [Zavarzinia compransoris]TDP48033.1 DnaE-like error-prone DNA polymerase [Zavarzinia compransoris]